MTKDLVTINRLKLISQVLEHFAKEATTQEESAHYYDASHYVDMAVQKLQEEL